MLGKRDDRTTMSPKNYSDEFRRQGSAARGADETPEQELARLRARVRELAVGATKWTTEREILQRAAKYFAGETNW